MLTKAHRQEALSRSYVQAIAAKCGMSCTPRVTDYGIDLSLHDIVINGKRRSESGFAVDVQAKSTTVGGGASASIKYDLEARAYDNLRDPTAGCSRILVVLMLPEDEALWVTQTAEALTLRRCAYWLSLRGREALPNQRSVRVTLPEVNVFSASALREMINRLKQGGVV